MKKKFNFVFSPFIYVLAGIINMLVLVVLVMNSLKLANVEPFASTNIALDVSAIVLCVILGIVVNIFIFASSYTITDKHLMYALGFIHYKITLDNIFLVREEKNTHAMVVNYKRLSRDKNGSEVCLVNGLVINISNKRKDEFVSTLREQNSAIQYELITKDVQ